MNPEAIRSETKKLWEELFADVMRECQYDAAFGASIDEEEMAASLETTAHLQPWLHILEDSIQWLANVSAILDRLMQGDSKSNWFRSVWALVGASCVHAVAVRRLVLSGLDTPARGALRALDEHLSACVVLLHDRELASAFQAQQTPEDASAFWYKHLNTKSLKKGLNEVEREVGLEPHVSREMRSWREDELATFSQAIHPSYVASALTIRTLSLSSPNKFGFAILGKASASSERTLNYACKSIYYFSRFGFLILFNKYRGRPSIIALEKEDEMHQMAVIGRDVLAELNKKYWEYKIISEHDPS